MAHRRSTYTLAALAMAEADRLAFMREAERLAHDAIVNAPRETGS